MRPCSHKLNSCIYRYFLKELKRIKITYIKINVCIYIDIKFKVYIIFLTYMPNLESSFYFI